MSENSVSLPIEPAGPDAPVVSQHALHAPGPGHALPERSDHHQAIVEEALP